MSKWKLWVALVASVLVCAAAVGLAYVWWLADPTAVPRRMSTAPVEKRTLSQFVPAAGYVESPETVSLSFAAQGRILAVYVRKGDRVEAGTVVAEMDASEVDTSLRAAEAALALSQARLAQVQEPPRPTEVSAAQAALAAAEARYREAAAGPLRAEIASAEADLKSAQVAYDQLLSGPDPEELRVLQAEVNKAEVELRRAQGEYDRFAWREGFGASPQAAALEQATIDYQRALGAYNLATAPTTEDILERARAAIVAAEARLERLLEGGGSQVEAAAAAVAQAEAEVERLTSLPDPRAVDVARAQVRQSEIALEQARALLDGTTLFAPIDGLAIDVSASAGEISSPSVAAITLVAEGSGRLVARVHESFVPQVAAGQSATASFDALGTSRVGAKVVSVAPLPNGNLPVTYDVTLALTDDMPELRPGMSAEVIIATSVHENALTVPRGALSLVKGAPAIEVLRQGRPTTVPVELGISEGRHIEILSGVQEGDEVVLGSSAVVGYSSLLGEDRG